MEKAIATLNPKEVQVRVKWIPFQLNPDSPEKSIKKMDAYYKKFGKDRVTQLIPYMKNVGESSQINFSYGGKIGNTLRSHRLVEFAEKKDPSLRLQNEFIEELFSGYFEKEKDIADNAYLAELAVKTKLFVSDKESDALTNAKKFLTSNELVKEVETKLKNNSEGINGVPYFKVKLNGVEVEHLSGGQDTGVWLQLFAKLKLKTDGTTSEEGKKLADSILQSFYSPAISTSTITTTTTTMTD